jgi:hypothetical protein
MEEFLDGEDEPYLARSVRSAPRCVLPGFEEFEFRLPVAENVRPHTRQLGYFTDRIV